MKKWIAIFLAAVMAFGLAPTAMADGTEGGITLDQNTTSQHVKFSFVVPESFIWTIPEFTPEVTADKITAAGDLEFSEVYIPISNGYVIAVTITSKNGNCFKDEAGNEIPYTLTAPNPVSGKDSYFLLEYCEGDDVVSFNVSLEASREGRYTAGTFSDQLTFSAQPIDPIKENIIYDWPYGYKYAG